MIVDPEVRLDLDADGVPDLLPIARALLGARPHGAPPDWADPPAGAPDPLLEGGVRPAPTEALRALLAEVAIPVPFADDQTS